MTTPAARLGPPLMRTKLEAPTPRETVPRPSLLGTLAAGTSKRLTLVRAPAGWGKTTLLAAWRASESRRPFAWVALDGSDNDPGTFCAYVIEALHSLSAEVGAASLPLLAAPGVGLRQELLPALVNELTRLPERSVLVLDDYHLIRNQEIHETLTLLVDHLPRCLHVVVASRTEPPFPLPRLRAAGELSEIDARDLAFSRGDAAALLNDVHGLDISSSDVDRLWERTEGWAAGLYLAVLSLGHQPDRHAFITTFAGDDRHLVDYLGAEVLGDQRPELYTFLLRTSILEPFCPALCQAVTGDEHAPRLLAEIERSNAFLVPLDGRREWYRYHHLFREVLRHELQLTEPASVPELHRRAAAWLLEAGFVSEAITHLAVAGDAAEAGELIARHWFPRTQAGQRATVESWLDALPDAVLRADARLCLARAWVSFMGGRLDDVLPWAEAAEQAGVPGPLWAGVTSPAADAATLRTSYYLLTGDLGRAQDIARLALDLEESPPWRAVAFNCLGTASYWLGGEGEAVELLQETARAGSATNPVVAIFALGHLALIEAEAAEPDAAERYLADAARLIDSAGAAEYWVTACSHLARGRLLAGRGFLREAAPELARGVELARRGSPRIVLAYGLLVLAGVRRALEDPSAPELVGEARHVVAGCPDPGDRIHRLLDGAPRSAPRRTVPDPGEELSDRERAVLRLLATRLSQREIGRELDVSLNTIKSHTRSIFRKLDVPGRREAVERARDAGLL